MVNRTTPSSAHTAGPWFIGKKFPLAAKPADSNDRFEWYIFSDKWSIATVPNDVIGHANQDAEANARLIAAAPALLDACRAAVSALNQIPNRKLSPIVGGIHKTTYSVCSMLDAAIEKAEGSALCVKCGKNPRDTAHGNDWCEHCIADLPF